MLASSLVHPSPVVAPQPHLQVFYAAEAFAASAFVAVNTHTLTPFPFTLKLRIIFGLVLGRECSGKLPHRKWMQRIRSSLPFRLSSSISRAMSGEAPRVLTSDPADPGECRFVRLTKQRWVDAQGIERAWETAERTTRKGKVDAVLIPTILKRKGSPDHIILVSQFRPPANNFMLEFPAGLVDAGEDASVAAARELKEETGYVGDIVDVSPMSYADPGMSNANLQFVTIEVNGDVEPNLHPLAEPDEGEAITTHLVPLASLQLFIRQKRLAGMDVDGKLMAWADAYALTATRAQATKSFIEMPFVTVGLAVLAGFCGYMMRGGW